MRLWKLNVTVFKFILPVVFSTVHVCFGQAHNYVQTDTTIINRIASLTGRFILQKPLKNDFSLYFDTMDIKELVTTNEFIEMKNKYPFLKKGDFKMDKSTIDTSLWTASDFGGKILVDNNNTGLDYKEILHKYQLKPDKKLRDTIWNYNNDDCFRRKLINKVSKPVFNSARTVCAIEVFDDDICGEGFRETTYLFFKEGTDWILFDLIFRRQAKY